MDGRRRRVGLAPSTRFSDSRLCSCVPGSPVMSWCRSFVHLSPTLATAANKPCLSQPSVAVAVALQVSGYTKAVVRTNPECPVCCNEEMAVAADQGVARLMCEWRRTHTYGCATACSQSSNDQDIHSIQKEQRYGVHNQRRHRADATFRFSKERPMTTLTTQAQNYT